MAGIDLSGTEYTGATDSDISTTTGAASALTAVTAAITQLATDRHATVGANEERLNYTGQELGVLSTNLSAANSQISDVDVATESTNFAKHAGPRAVRHVDAGPGESEVRNPC